MGERGGGFPRRDLFPPPPRGPRDANTGTSQTGLPSCSQADEETGQADEETMTPPRCYRGPAGEATGLTPCGIHWAHSNFTDTFAGVTCTDCRWNELVARGRRGDAQAVFEVMTMLL